jgi:hypothetical protein
MVGMVGMAIIIKCRESNHRWRRTLSNGVVDDEQRETDRYK